MSARGGLALVLAAVGCRSEFVVGVLAASEASSSSSTSGIAPSTSESTLGSTSSSAGESGSSSSSGPACGESSGSDDTTATTGPLPTCEAPSGHSVCDSFDADPFHALGLGCPGGAQETTPVANAVLTAEAATFAVATRFGADGNEHWLPREGSKLVALTTGTFDMVGDHIEVPLGRTYAVDGDNPNGDGELPAPVVPAAGNAPGPCAQPYVGCDGIGDCSDTLPPVWDEGGALARDLAWLRFEVDVPAGTFGWALDLAWFTAEYPEAHVEPATDLLLVWQSSLAYTGNVATIDGSAMTVAGVGATIATGGFTGNAPELSGTGFEATEVGACETPWVDYAAGQCPNGGATPWLTLQGAAHPGETLTIAIAVFDMGTTDLDSAVLLDNWRWRCEGCDAGDDCGVGPLQTP